MPPILRKKPAASTPSEPAAPVTSPIAAGSTSQPSPAVSEVSFARPFEVFAGVYVTRLDGQPIGRLASSDKRVCPAMWLEGDYLVLSTGHRMHTGGGLVAWFKL